MHETESDIYCTYDAKEGSVKQENIPQSADKNRNNSYNETKCKRKCYVKLNDIFDSNKWTERKNGWKNTSALKNCGYEKSVLRIMDIDISSEDYSKNYKIGKVQIDHPDSLKKCSFCLPTVSQSFTKKIIFD